MQTAIASIFVFLLVVLLHELGHFIVAKIIDIKVNEFSIGMGPKLIQSEKGETKYTLRLLPIGGYVRMEGEDEGSSDPRSFNNASPWGRIAVIAAGAIMNFVLAIIVLTLVAFNTGTPSTTIEKTIEGRPAESSGIMSGDKIININGKNINSWNSLSNTISKSDPNSKIKIIILRDGLEKEILVNPYLEENRVMIGIEPRYEKSFLNSMKSGIENTVILIGVMFEFLKMLFKGQVTTNDISGPIGVINEIGNAATMGFSNLLMILGFISVNLGFFNLLPIPALDGSKIMLTLIEIIRGKPMDPNKEYIIHLIGFIMLISLMLVVTYKDLVRIYFFR